MHHMDPFYTQAFPYILFIINKTLICGQNGQGISFYPEDICYIASDMYIYSVAIPQ